MSKKFGFLFIWVFLGALILGSCNFPLFASSQDEDYVSTIAALQATSSAMALMPAGTEAPLAPEVVVTEAPAEELPTATMEIIHNLMPSEPGANHESGITDADTSAAASEKRAVAGENFAEGLLERPFNADTMDTYYPELDITRTWLNHNDTWMFIMIQMSGVDDEGKLSGAYAAEFDLNVDGRGDILVLANQPGAEWSVNGVEVWQDTNEDIGHNVPVGSDPPQGGDGYDKMLFNSGQGNDADLAWVRIDPGNPAVVQLAVKYSALNNDMAYMWGVWAQDAFHPEWFDYNDHFTLAEAGSASTIQAQYYPIKALAKVDNTCRWAVGFTPTGSEPGICYVPATPTPKPTITKTTAPNPGTVYGLVFYDYNANQVRNPGEPGLANAVVKLYNGSCSSTGSTVGTQTTNGTGWVTFTGVPAGTYCLKVTTAPPGGYAPVTGSGPVTVSLSAGGTVYGYLPYTIYVY